MKTRRRFLAGLATVPLAPAALAAPQAAPSPAVTPEPGPGAVARSLTEGVRQRFPEHGLGEAELAEIARKIDSRLKAAERLRALKLGNADEPVTRFSPRAPKP